MKRGFTLIELVMVIVILGILAATALPRFIDLTAKAKESAAKGAIGGIRAAIAIKYADNIVNYNNTNFPATLDGTLFADGLVPKEPFHNSNAVASVESIGDITGSTGGWAYNAASGEVWINDATYAPQY